MSGASESIRHQPAPRHQEPWEAGKYAASGGAQDPLKLLWL